MESWRSVAAFRSELYHFLGQCLLEPISRGQTFLLQPDFWRQFALAPANASMRTALEQLALVADRLSRSGEAAACEAVQAEYVKLFLGPGEPAAPPWESLYRPGERVLFGPPALQVREIMAEAGVEMARKYSQPEDHLGIELIFLALLAARDSQDSGGDWRGSANLQAKFLTEHPGAWVDSLRQDAVAHSTTGFYAAIITLIQGVLLWDQELLAEYSGEALLADAELALDR